VAINRLYDPGTVLVRDHRYWVPLVALFSDARLNELEQLEVTDVQEGTGVTVLKITTLWDGDDPGDEKLIKTVAGERIVPIHPELMRLGFLDYVKQRR
jgi:hypothetical protein